MAPHRLLLGSLLACLVALPVAGTAAADEAPSGLVLSVQDEGSGRFTTTQLRCDPPGGRHPNAPAACAALETVGADFTQLPAETHKSCPFIFRPVVAAARGLWHGRPVDYTKEYANSCFLHVSTDPVFVFAPA
ncbi:serine protease [Solihabitans fulvus]|uniref:Serine protease n=1 Tax=Solihabitans fulvus TaxID=1892852 RepID=A0A5B2WS17_9PSEU|nr:SSI family serine proteinase inhibitor [Solihabitans fulvus]KAA2254315.1 serine protease [Solihabitans fulvus]